MDGVCALAAHPEDTERPTRPYSFAQKFFKRFVLWLTCEAIEFLPLCVFCVLESHLPSVWYSQKMRLVEGEVGLQTLFCARHKGKGVACSLQQNQRRLSALFKGLPLPLLSLL